MTNGSVSLVGAGPGHPDYLTVKGARVLAQAEVIIYDACLLAGKPFSHAGILRFDGQLISVLPGKTACYRCIFHAPPPPNAVPSCSQTGVLGVVAGVIGCLQATEALKFLLGRNDLISKALLTWNAFWPRRARLRQLRPVASWPDAMVACRPFTP